MVGEVKVITNRGVKLPGVDSGPVSIKPPLKCSLGFSHILYTTYSTRNEIHYIRCGTGDVAPDPVEGIVGITGDRIPCLDMVLANNAPVGITCESTLLSGRNSIRKRGDFSSHKKISKIAGASVGQDGAIRNCSL